MTLRDDLEAAVDALGGNATTELIDDAWTTVLPIGDGRVLPAQVRLDATGQYITLLAPLARLSDDTDASVLATLLSRNANPVFTDAASYGIEIDEDGAEVMALYHWALPDLRADAFAALLVTFARAVRGMHQDLAELAEMGAPLDVADGDQLSDGS